MGVKLGNAIGGRRGGGDDLVEAHEINVTPFIDVMLVLLIIFMNCRNAFAALGYGLCLNTIAFSVSPAIGEIFARPLGSN